VTARQFPDVLQGLFNRIPAAQTAAARAQIVDLVHELLPLSAEASRLAVQAAIDLLNQGTKDVESACRLVFVSGKGHRRVQELRKFESVSDRLPGGAPGKQLVSGQWVGTARKRKKFDVF